VRRPQGLQSKCLRLATGALLYLSNRQIHEDLGFPLFADHIRALTASFDSKLADVGNPLLRQLGRYLRWPRVDPVAWRESQGRQGPAGQSRPSPAMANSTKRIAFGAYQPNAFRIHWGFPWFYSVIKQIPRYTIQSRGTARIPPPPCAAASPKRLQNVVFATQPVCAQNPDSQPSKIYPSQN